MYNIVCITNEEYIQHTAVMLVSLFETNAWHAFRIYVITPGLSSSSSERLQSIVPLDSKLVILTESHLMTLGTHYNEVGGKSWNPIMYLKLFMPQIINEDVHRLLFLDVDMIINTDIEKIYNLNLGDNVLAGAEDWKYSVDHRKRLGLNDDDAYINSGVMVVNVDAWKIFDRKNSMKQFLIENEESIRNDQDAFALYFKGKILYIDQRWNTTTYFFERKPRIFDKYLEDLETVRRSPYIIHFCEPIKPWFRECRHPYRHLYRKYLGMTPWKEYHYPSCGLHFGKPAWRYVVKHWLNVLGFRHDDWSMVTL